jgi:hypothetical protein
LRYWKGLPTASPTGTEPWYRKHVDLPQTRVSILFSDRHPLSLTKLVGKREIKASLRTSDAMSAKMRGRVLSNGLEQLFRELRSMADVSNEVIVNRAKDYFKVQLSKSLELALLLPTDPYIDIDFEITGTDQLAARMREELKKSAWIVQLSSATRIILKVTFVFAIRHYAGVGHKREQKNRVWMALRGPITGSDQTAQSSRHRRRTLSTSPCGYRPSRRWFRRELGKAWR